MTCFLDPFFFKLSVKWNEIESIWVKSGLMGLLEMIPVTRIGSWWLVRLGVCDSFVVRVGGSENGYFSPHLSHSSHDLHETRD